MLVVRRKSFDVIINNRICRQQWSGVAVSHDVEGEGRDGIIMTGVPMSQLRERLQRTGGNLRHHAAGESFVFIKASDDIAAVGLITCARERRVRRVKWHETEVKW